MKRLITLSIVAGFLLTAPSLQAQESSEDDYATYYGDGLRYYAEGRYQLALENLYRAYAARPSRNLMKLIVRTHDFMGHCTAAERQMALFEELYPRAESPSLQICANPGTLVLECRPYQGTVVVDHSIVAKCGTELRVPAGEHRIDSQLLVAPQKVEVKSGERATAELVLNPEKWHPRPGQKRQTKVQRLPGQRYTVFQTADGLYQIWVRSTLDRDPDMDPGAHPGFTIIRRPDGLYDISSDKLREPFDKGQGGAREPKKNLKVPMLPLD